MAEFDPDEYLATPSVSDSARPRDKYTPVESGLIGAGQGVTMGFGDEILGGIGALASKDPRFGQPVGQGSPSIVELYKKLRDKARAQDTLAKSDNPYSYRGGNFAGTAATALIPGINAAKGASIGTTMLKGGMAGGLIGAGESEAELTDANLSDLVEFGQDVGGGALLGGGTAGVLGQGGKVLKQLSPSSLRSFAGNRATKAVTGNNKALVKDIFESGMTPAEFGQSMLKKKIVTPLANSEDIYSRALKEKTKTGDLLGGIRKEGSRLGSVVDDEKMAQELEKYLETIPEAPHTTGIRDKLQAQIDHLRSQKGAMSLEKAERLKGTFDYDPGSPTSSELGPMASNQLYGTYMKGAEEGLDATMQKNPSLAEMLGKDELGKPRTYKDVKGDYKTAILATEGGANQRLKDFSNRSVSPSSHMLGIAGGVVGDNMSKKALIGGLLGAGNEFALKYGNQLMATGADKAAAILEKSPEVLKKFAGPLSNAAQRSLQSGGPAFIATHQILMKDPEYRQIIDAEKTLKGDNNEEFDPDKYLGK